MVESGAKDTQQVRGGVKWRNRADKKRAWRKVEEDHHSISIWVVCGVGKTVYFSQEFFPF